MQEPQGIAILVGFVAVTIGLVIVVLLRNRKK